MTANRGFWVGMAMGFCFALGCGAAITVIPAARAQAAQRWEYVEVRERWNDRWPNEAGAEGWELVCGEDDRFYLKRPLP